MRPIWRSRLATHSEQGDDKEFGAYLPHEEISAELAQTCEELRRFVDERGQEAGEACAAVAIRFCMRSCQG